MGWWSEQGKKKELVIGDQPLDVVGAMLSQVLVAYGEEVGRKPTPEELAKTIEAALASRIGEMFDGVEQKELAGVVIKFKKGPQVQVLKVGDYFAIPLSNGGYGYGKIEDIAMQSLLLVGLLGVHSREVLEIADLARTGVLLECVCGNQGLMRGEWPVIGNLPPLQPPADGTEEERCMEYQLRLGGAHSYLRARELLEERLGAKRRHR